MSDDDYYYKSGQLTRVERPNVTKLDYDTGMPTQGGFVNRWFDRQRISDNQVRAELMRSFIVLYDVGGDLYEAYSEFERKKAEVARLSDIIQLDDEVFRNQQANIRHQIKMDEQRRATESASWEKRPEEQANHEPTQSKKPKTSWKDRVRREFENIMQTGTPDERGAIAEAVIDKYKEEWGPDESKWTHEQQEFAKRVRMHAKRGRK